MGLQVKNLTAGYGEKMVLQDCSFEVEPGETLVLMGPSGGGKSTLLLALVGVLPMTSGEAVLNGRSIGNLPLEERNIGYFPQDYGLFPHLDVAQNVEYGLMVRDVPMAKRQEISAQMLKLVNLIGFERRRIKELSGGQKQRVALARALAVRPDLILLDEPLSNVDQITKFEVANNLRKIFEKIDIPKIVVTHTLYDAFVLADRLGIIIEGKLVQLDTPHNVMAKPKNTLIRKLLKQMDVRQIRR